MDVMLAKTIDIGSSVQAQPPMVLHDVEAFQQTQCFDVSAIVAAISKKSRYVSTTRKVFDVTLLDNSGPGGKACSAQLSCYDDDQPSSKIQVMLEVLRAAGDVPIFLFRCSARKPMMATSSPFPKISSRSRRSAPGSRSWPRRRKR